MGLLDPSKSTRHTAAVARLGELASSSEPTYRAASPTGAPGVLPNSCMSMRHACSSSERNRQGPRHSVFAHPGGPMRLAAGGDSILSPALRVGWRWQRLAGLVRRRRGGFSGPMCTSFGSLPHQPMRGSGSICDHSAAFRASSWHPRRGLRSIERASSVPRRLSSSAVAVLQLRSGRSPSRFRLLDLLPPFSLSPLSPWCLDAAFSCPWCAAGALLPRSEGGVRAS